MKRVISILLLLSIAFSFSACTPHRSEEITCEDIIAAYENAGYTMEHHLHEDPVYPPATTQLRLSFRPTRLSIISTSTATAPEEMRRMPRSKASIIPFFGFSPFCTARGVGSAPSNLAYSTARPLTEKC